MPDEHDRRQRELIEAVWNDYDDDAPRLAYAAWLDTIDDPADTARAECIRESVRLAKFPYDGAYEPGSARVGELLKKYRTAWLAGLPVELGSYSPRLIRGMFEAHTNATARELLANGDRWFRRAPPDVAFQVWFRPEQWKRNSRLPPVDWPALLAKPWWERAIGLEMGGQGAGAEVCAAIAANPAMRRLRLLSLNRCPIGDEGVVSLAASPHLASVRILNLVQCDLSRAGALAVITSATLPRLYDLFLAGNPLTNDDWTAIESAVAGRGRVYRGPFSSIIRFDPNAPEVHPDDEPIPF